jgi:hypothetical protein
LNTQNIIEVDVEVGAMGHACPFTIMPSTAFSRLIM